MNRFWTGLTLIAMSLLAGGNVWANDLSYLNLPAGYKIEVWAEVPGARSLAVTEDGRHIYVGTRDDQVFRLTDENLDQQVDHVEVYLEGLKVPNGIALDPDNNLYIAEQHQIIKVTADKKRTVILPPGLLPDRRHHGWRYMALGPDGYLYVAVGAPCNICRVKGVEGTIIRVHPNIGQAEIYAKGVRNSVGFDWHPETKEFFFTDNGGDNLGDLIPPDELNRTKKAGQHFGYPFFYDEGQPYPQFSSADVSGPFKAPVIRFEAHAAALGIEFYEGQQFPKDMRNSAIVAQHGSWNRSDPIGYRLMRVGFDQQGNPADNTVFVDGWLRPDGEVKGRPVDLAELPDGSLLVSDDYADVIYRITFLLK